MHNRMEISLILALCIAVQAHAAVNCQTTGPGRFADPDDKSCQKYAYCVYNPSTSSYLSYNYACPTPSVFNPKTAKCTASNNYVCNITSSNNTSKSSVCTSDGFVADPSSKKCSSFIECVEINGTYTETTYTCPDGTYFDPNTTFCTSDYKCPSSTTFSCTGAGRFTNTADSTCKTYYLCVSYSNGTFAQYKYTCPTTSVFNPRSKVCTIFYRCTAF